MKAKTLSVALALCIAGWAGAAVAVEARSPIWDDTACKVTHTTYYSCSGDYHGAVDFSNGTCGVWSMRAMLVGSLYWNVYAGCNTSCAAPGTWVNGSNGYSFYQYNFIANSNSYSRTCDRCALGLVGPKEVHAQNTQNSTRLTAWYSGYVTCGAKCGSTYLLGYPRMS
jgi:hypothetical protein